MTIVKPELAQFFKCNEVLRAGQFDDAAQYLIDSVTTNKPKVSGDGLQYFNQLVPGLLDFGWYTEVGAMLWGNLFATEPWSVKTIWDALLKYPDLLIIGAGSLGKSYSIGAWAVLDWIRDPTQTCFKVVSLTKEHAKRNAFANMLNLHAASVIPLPGEKTATTIQSGDNPKQGIHLEAIRQGDDGQGKLRGFHPDPRTIPHSKFIKTRIRAVLDEGEEIPTGVWPDVDNMFSSKFDDEHVKIISAANPRDPNSKMGQRVLPVGGIDAIDPQLEYWKSAAGWNVVHLSGANCENVREKKVRYPGLLTWEGFQRYLALGDNNPDYYTFALGIYPRQGLQKIIISPDLVSKNIGNFHFVGVTTALASYDLAFEGGDLVVCTTGKFGYAVGWTNAHGEFIAFPEEKGRFAVQVEAQFTLPKKRTLELVNDIMALNRHLKVAPQWCIVDRTGNGTGAHDALVSLFGSDVMGLNYGTAATSSRLFIEDSKPASELYDGVVTELFFALRHMLEFEIIKFSPHLNFSVLTPELTGRIYRRKGGKSRVEPKEEFRARYGASPDSADSCTLFAHLVRMRADTEFRMTPEPKARKQPTVRSGEVDKLEFVDTFSD